MSKDDLTIAYMCGFEDGKRSVSSDVVLGDAAEVEEEFAAHAHDMWSGWMKYLFSKCHEVRLEPTLADPDGELNLVIPKWAVDRWVWQMNTEYKDLPEEEKISDREEAAKIIQKVLRRFT